jgi:hypothetical protein
MKDSNKEVKKNNAEYAYPATLSENIFLCNPIFNEKCRKEIKEINKHEIIIKICELMGPCPDNLCKAEAIFEKLKYEMANFVVHHEYKSPHGISTELVLWLDTKTNPGKLRKLDNFIKKYLK